MLPPAEAREAAATELLRIAGLPAVRAALLRYARQLTSDADAAQDHYQQAILDGHDAVQRHGFSGEQEQDYVRYLRRAIRSKHLMEAERRGKLTSFDLARHEQVNTPLPEAGPAYLAGQLARAIEQHPDRVLLRLHADGHSSRQIAALTGRPDRSVARAIATLKDSLRARFAQAWASLD